MVIGTGVAWALAAWSSATDAVGNGADHAATGRREAEIARANRELQERKAQVEAIHAVGEAHDTVAAPRDGSGYSGCPE